jgi:hypothetical protein
VNPFYYVIKIILFGIQWRMTSTIAVLDLGEAGSAIAANILGT